jgi:UDP-N-acetyl-D-mannosaminuronate dehydrogenase
LRKERLSAPVIEQAMAGIAARPQRVVARVRETLSGRGQGLTGARVLVVGVAYKPDVEDLRESPALEILAELAAQGAVVAYHDPIFPTVTLPNGISLIGVDDPAAFRADLVLLHTTHRTVDQDWLAGQPIVLDATYRLAEVPNRVVL